MTTAPNTPATPPGALRMSHQEIFADHDRRMLETARLVTESLQAGKSDREVLLENLLARARADRIRKQNAAR